MNRSENAMCHEQIQNECIEFEISRYLVSFDKFSIDIEFNSIYISIRHFIANYTGQLSDFVDFVTL
jgi:hypothetical protein